MKPVVYLAVGAAFSAVIIVACSDDSPQNADAATCDCPAAESPITAQRMVRIDAAETLAANDGATPFAQCPADSVLLTGSCYIDQDNTAREVSLVAFGITPEAASAAPQSWNCFFDNKSLTATATVRAQALCLTPAR